jgi:DNA-binding NtrC family response regulator
MLSACAELQMSETGSKAGRLPEDHAVSSGTWPTGARRGATRALIADDDPQLLRALARILRNAGLEVQTAESPGDALELLAHDSFDVIVTDLFMPDMSGAQILASARVTDPRLPVVMISGNASMSVWLDELGDPSLYFLAKPFSGQDLCCLVRRLVGLPDDPKQLARSAHSA